MKRLLRSATALVILGVSIFTAPGADAEPLTGEPWQIYAKSHNARICAFLQRHPTKDGLHSAIKDISIESGMSPKDSGLALGMAVFGRCPQYMILLTQNAPSIPPGPPGPPPQ